MAVVPESEISEIIPEVRLRQTSPTDSGKTKVKHVFIKLKSRKI